MSAQWNLHKTPKLQSSKSLHISEHIQVLGRWQTQGGMGAVHSSLPAPYLVYLLHLAVPEV